MSSSQLAQKISGRGLSPANVRAGSANSRNSVISRNHIAVPGESPPSRVFASTSTVSQPRLHPGDRRSINEVQTALNPRTSPSNLPETGKPSWRCCLCFGPSDLGQRFKEIGIVRCQNAICCYFVSAHNHVQQKLVVLNQDLSAETVQRLQNYINELIQSRTLDEVRVFLTALFMTPVHNATSLTTAWAFGARASHRARFLSRGHRQSGHADLRAHRIHRMPFAGDRG